MYKINDFSFFLFELLIILTEFTYIKSYITLPLDTIKPENLISPYIPNSVEDLMFAE